MEIFSFGLLIVTCFHEIFFSVLLLYIFKKVFIIIILFSSYEQPIRILKFNNKSFVYLLYEVLLQGKVFFILLIWLVILAFYGAFWSQLKLLPCKKVNTRCASHFENSTASNRHALLMIPHPLSGCHIKAEVKGYLEPKEQGRGINMRAWPCHRRQRVKNPPRARKKSTKYAFRGEKAWRRPDDVTPFYRVSN